ncbi:hypothetical protein WME94_44165 [Sorangium sp. So ce429]
MMQNGAEEQLIDDLLTDPQRFDEDGRAYALLQRYFAGLPLDTLRPLLRSDNVFVQRTASFIASELGSKISSVIDDVVPLVNSSDMHVQWYAMEALTVCARGEHVEKFAHVVEMLENPESPLRRLAMRLVANAELPQLEAARRHFEFAGQRHGKHQQGLLALIAGNRIGPAVIVAMLGDGDALVRRYGAIAARRLMREYPDLISHVRSTEDPELHNF